MGSVSDVLAAVVAFATYVDLIAYALSRAFVTLFSRLTPNEVLLSSVRGRIFASIRERPGCTIRAIQRELGLGWGATIYHVRILEFHDFIATEARGRAIHVFPETLPSGQRGAAILLRSKFHRAILDLALARREVSIIEIAAELGIARTTAKRRTKALVGAGLIEYRTADRIMATPATRKALM